MPHPVQNLHHLTLPYGLLLVLLLIGCADGGDSGSEATTFTDDLGRTVTVPPAPQRVVTLSPNLTEIVYAAGAGPKLAGANAADDYPPAVDTLPRFSVLPVDFEAVAALEPDLVLATDQTNNPRDAETFASLDIPIAFFSFDEAGDVFRAIREVGALLNTPRAARATADSLEATLDRIAQKSADAARPLVLFLIGDETLYAFGSGSYVHELIRIAGGRSATSDLDTKAPVLNEEFVLTNKPDVIIGTFGEEYDTSQLLKLHPTWTNVPAIQNNRVYSINGNLILRPGPRIVRGTRRMAAWLHPRRFALSDSLEAGAAP